MAWWTLCAAIGLACLVVWQLPVDVQLAMRWRAGAWQAQPWTLWTAALSHINTEHLGLNLLALLCLSTLAAQAGAAWREAVALATAWPLLHLALLLWPQVQLYAGLSGLNHALAGIIVVQHAMYFIATRQGSWFAALFGGALIAKLLHEAAWHTPIRADADWGFAVVQAGHLSGFVCGLLVALGLALWARARGKA